MIVSSLKYHHEEISSIGLYQAHWLHQHGLISIKGIRWVAIIKILWGIIVTFTLIVNSILITESTIQKWFILWVFTCKIFYGICTSNSSLIMDSSIIRLKAKNKNPICASYEMVIFPQVLDNFKDLIIEITSPTFSKSKRVPEGQAGISFIPLTLMGVPINKYEMFGRLNIHPIISFPFGKVLQHLIEKKDYWSGKQPFE